MHKNRCAFCEGELGLGVRFRKLWNGIVWAHLRFCSTDCETQDELARRNANWRARWHSYLDIGSR